MFALRGLLCALALSVTSLVWAEPFDINTADAQTIADNMNGVGLTKAQAIVDYRTKNGPFNSLQEVADVKGIGEKTLMNNKDVIQIGQSRPAPRK